MTAVDNRISTSAFSGVAAVARRDITPPIGIRARNWGPADWDASEGNHRSMTLTVVALRASDPLSQPYFVVAIDGTWWRRVDDEWRVRGGILTRLGITADVLMLSLSHTHAGPVLCATDADSEGGHLIDDYLDLLVTSAASAASEALSELSPARLEWVTSRCTLASNRELQLSGRALVGFNPGIEADDTLVVGRLSTPSGKPMATIVNYACHPTTLGWQNRLVSPDYVGAMRQTVEDATDSTCVFLQGASGELAPREQYTGDLAVADRHGTALGHAVLSALATLPSVGTELALDGVVESGAPLAMWLPRVAAADGTIAHKHSGVDMDLVPLPRLDELAKEWADIDERSREERLRRAKNLRDGYVVGETVQHPVWAWRVGDAILVAHPGEAYSQFQTTLRERFSAHHIVVINLTNGPGFVYLPTRDAYEAEAYQAWQTPLAPGSLERLVAHATIMISELLEDER